MSKRSANRGACLFTTLMVMIPAGEYTPLYSESKQQKTIVVNAFYLDVYPVTNREFLGFVTERSQWKKSRVVSLFSDKNYLQSWVSDLELGRLNPESPVTTVSWFAAKAYCQWVGKRLPIVDEWEYAAQPTENGVHQK